MAIIIIMFLYSGDAMGKITFKTLRKIYLILLKQFERLEAKIKR